MTEMPFSQSRLAYFDLEHRIVTLMLTPGMPVTEKQLIALAGLGRTPVREAIQQLALLGLMRVRPRAGLEVTPIRPKDRENIRAIRCKLEPDAAMLAADHANDAQRTALRACASEMTSCAITGDLDAFVKAVRIFYEVIDAACPNGFLSTALGPARAHARRLWCVEASPQKMDRCVALHVGVIRAIQKGQAADAATAMAALVEAFDG